MTAVAAMPGCFRTWFSTVVLPLPRNPVSTVTGIREAGSLAGIDDRLLWRATRGRRLIAGMRCNSAGTDTHATAYYPAGTPQGSGMGFARGADVPVGLLGRVGDLSGVERFLRLFGISRLLASALESKRSGIPHLTPALSVPQRTMAGGEGVKD